MHSVVYRSTVMHNRLGPKPHRFSYKIFMFYLDLAELPRLHKKLALFSHNKFNFFSFRDKEHLQLPASQPDISKTTAAHIRDYLDQQGFGPVDGRIMLLTNLNVLGYNFNPVSFYFCFAKNGEPLCAVAEVSNTFREMKPFLLKRDGIAGDAFYLYTKKYFYVSPFIDHDTDLEFSLSLPGEKLNIRIDDYKDGNRFFISTLTGKRKPLTNRVLFWYSIRFPFITLRIMLLIHWNALLLWLKKLPYQLKSENQHLQQGVYRKYKNK
jgi:DUF1365 family protein